MGRPRKRKNEKFEPEKLSNGETKLDLLTHVRYPIMKSGNDWMDFQEKEMKTLFELYPRMKTAYGLVCALQNVWKTILQVAISILTAIATTLGVTSCM
ncbi:MAG TPA: hypothetical protein DEQ17_01320 [Prevotella sp.]|nr:hypothetical protein [Prevotella sp.]